jgi:hypothetical protein
LQWIAIPNLVNPAGWSHIWDALNRTAIREMRPERMLEQLRGPYTFAHRTGYRPEGFD